MLQKRDISSQRKKEKNTMNVGIFWRLLSFCDTSPSQVYIDLIAPRINVTFSLPLHLLSTTYYTICEIK
jgi:hypothetical protein